MLQRLAIICFAVFASTDASADIIFKGVSKITKVQNCSGHAVGDNAIITYHPSIDGNAAYESLNLFQQYSATSFLMDGSVFKPRLTPVTTSGGVGYAGFTGVFIVSQKHNPSSVAVLRRVPDGKAMINAPSLYMVGEIKNPDLGPNPVDLNCVITFEASMLQQSTPFR